MNKYYFKPYLIFKPMYFEIKLSEIVNNINVK